MAVLDDLQDVTVKQFNNNAEVYRQQVDEHSRDLESGKEVVIAPHIMTRIISMENRVLLQRGTDIHFWGELTSIQRHIAVGITMKNDSKTKQEENHYSLLVRQYKVLYQAMIDTGQPCWIIPPMSFLTHIRKQVETLENKDFFKSNEARLYWSTPNEKETVN